MADTIAPVAPAAPVTETVSDVFVPDTSSHAVPGRTFNDTIRAVANKTSIKADPVVEAPVVKIVPDALTHDAPGSHDAPPGSVPPVSAEAVPVSSEPVSEISIDDGEVTLASQRNPDGTYKTKLDPNEKVDLVIKTIIDPETGKPKVYSKSLPELARLAKDGITLQQTVQKVQGELKAVQPEVEYYRTNVAQWKEHTESLTQRLADMEALNRTLLSAEDEVVIQHREAYKAEMSPEKQLERMQAERKAEQEQAKQTAQQQAAKARQEQIQKIATTFVESRIAPSLKAAEAAGLSKHTVTGLVTHITSDLMVNGVIPPANWPEMERRITAPDGPFQTELRAESARRTTESDSVKAAREAAERSQKQAQAVVNADGRLMAPIGRAGPDSAPKLPAAKNTKEVLDRIIHRPLPESVQRSA